MPGRMLALAGDLGRATLLEGFPDRGYAADGRLLPRDRPGAVLDGEDLVAANAVRLADSVDSLCVHGDNPGAVAHARACRRSLEASGWSLRGL
jgi:UPF0271 protein